MLKSEIFHQQRVIDFHRIFPDIKIICDHMQNQDRLSSQIFEEILIKNLEISVKI